MKIGFSEIVIIFIVALIVIGPEKLPEYARKLGEALRQFRNVSSDLTKDIKETVIEPLEEAQKPIREALQPMTDAADDIKKNITEVKTSVNNIGKTAPKKAEAVKSEKSTDSNETEVETASQVHEEDKAEVTAKEEVETSVNETGDGSEEISNEGSIEESAEVSEEKSNSGSVEETV